jgi:hypothetical protein
MPRTTVKPASKEAILLPSMFSQPLTIMQLAVKTHDSTTFSVRSRICSNSKLLTAPRGVAAIASGRTAIRYYIRGPRQAHQAFANQTSPVDHDHDSDVLSLAEMRGKA